MSIEHGWLDEPVTQRLPCLPRGALIGVALLNAPYVLPHSWLELRGACLLIGLFLIAWMVFAPHSDR